MTVFTDLSVSLKRVKARIAIDRRDVARNWRSKKYPSVARISSLALFLLLAISMLLPNGAAQANQSSAPYPSMIAAQQQTYNASGSQWVFGSLGPSGIAIGGGAQLNNGGPYEPPIPDQGGTCIEGFIIDRYDQARGMSWTVTATPENGAPITLYADSKGEFEFDDLTKGTWLVELDVPDGWQPYTPSSFNVSLSGDEDDDCAEVRFKVEALPCLEVIKLDDNGRAESCNNRLGIAGWKITATREDVILEDITDGTGKVIFYDMQPGTWTVKEEDKVGWQPIDDEDYAKRITLESPRKPEECQKLTFINEQVEDGCIIVQKTDTKGEPLSGWRITASRDDGTHEDITRSTDSNGYAKFEDLPLGDWTIEETVKDWWRSVGPTEQPVTLIEPGRCVKVLLTNESLGCIDGYKINSLDKPLEDWEITARNSDTNEVYTTETDEDGYFRFPDLTLGTWTITEELLQGWEAVTPSEVQVTLKDDFVCEHVRFKNRTKYACIDVFKRDVLDDSGIAGWEINLKPAYGDEITTGYTDGTGWLRFNGLTPGEYILWETIPDGWDNVNSPSRRLTLHASGTCTKVTFENRQDTDKKKDPHDKQCWLWYTVKPGDSLSEIASRFRTSVSAIKELNHLHSNKLRVGMSLCIPPDP